MAVLDLSRAVDRRQSRPPDDDRRTLIGHHVADIERDPAGGITDDRSETRSSTERRTRRLRHHSHALLPYGDK